MYLQNNSLEGNRKQEPCENSPGTIMALSDKVRMSTEYLIAIRLGLGLIPSKIVNDQAHYFSSDLEKLADAAAHPKKYGIDTRKLPKK